MRIELTNGIIIEISDGEIVKLDGMITNEFHGVTPDGRKFTINHQECIVYETSTKSSLPLDLIKLLKGHEGEMFWSPCWGECEFLEIHTRNGGRPSLKFRTKSGDCRNITPRGCLGYNYEGCGGECILWPSKDCQSWDDFGRDIWAVKKSTGELYLYTGHPKYGKLYLTTHGYADLLKSLGPEDIKRII